MWGGLLELAGLFRGRTRGRGARGRLRGGARHAASAAAIDEMLASTDRREQLHRLIAGLLGHGQEVLGRWADVMVNSGTYAEIVDRHVELDIVCTGGAACWTSQSRSRST